MCCNVVYTDWNPNIFVQISVKDWKDVNRRLDALEKGEVYVPEPGATLCSKCKQWHPNNYPCLADIAGRPSVMVS